MPAPPAVEPPALRRSIALEDLALLGHLRRLQRRVRSAGVGDDADGVVRAQGVDEHAEGVLEQRQPVLGCHRARGVDEQHQVGARALGLRHVEALDGDVDELVGGVPRRGQHRDRRPEGRAAVLGQRIVVGEVVDHLLDAHGLLRRQLRRIERPAHEGIGGAVDIDREGRDRLARHALDRVGGWRREAVAPVLGCLAPRSKCSPVLRSSPNLVRGSEPYL